MCMADDPDQPAKDVEAHFNQGAQDQSRSLSSSDIQDQANQQGWHPDEQEHKRHERRYWRFQYITSSITLLFSFGAAIGAFTGSYIAYQAFVASTQAVEEAKRQANAAESQVAVARDTAERQLRAYVLPEIALLHDISDPRPHYTFQAKNYGQTPAKELTVWVSWRYFDIKKIDFPTDPPNIPLSEYLVGPQGFTVHTDRVFLDDGRKAAIRDGTAVFLLFGEIKYKDVFDKDRTTKFKFAWGGGFSAETSGPLDVYSDGNEAD
jgi:hypothetical protein